MRFCLASVVSVLSQFWRIEKRIVGDRGRSGRNGRKEGRKDSDMSEFNCTDASKYKQLKPD